MNSKNIFAVAISVLILQGAAQAQDINVEPTQSNEQIHGSDVGRTAPLLGKAPYRYTTDAVQAAQPTEVSNILSPEPITQVDAQAGKYREFEINVTSDDNGAPVELNSDYTIVNAHYPITEDGFTVETLKHDQYQITRSGSGHYRLLINQSIAMNASQLEVYLQPAGACTKSLMILPQNPINTYAMSVNLPGNVQGFLWIAFCSATGTTPAPKSGGAPGAVTSSPNYDPSNEASKIAAVESLLGSLGYTADEIKKMCSSWGCEGAGGTCKPNGLKQGGSGTTDVSISGSGSGTHYTVTADSIFGKVDVAAAGCSCTYPKK